MLPPEAVLAPALLAAAGLRLLPKRPRRLASAAAAWVQLALASWLAWEVTTGGPVRGASSYFAADALSAWLTLATAVVGAGVATYSVPFMDLHEKHGDFARGLLPWYEPLLHASMAMLLLTLLTSNMGVVWIGLEATTILTAFLVGFYREEASVEAAWKYILLGSVGITLGFFGTVLLYYSSVQAFGFTETGLDWAALQANAPLLDPTLLKLAFVFVLIGYGTKAGLAPMHTWLPDAHSQAPSPISALLSAMFLNVAFYGLLRFHGITSAAVPGFSGTLLLAFGLFSVLIAAPFIVAQRDYKRLFAYSSVEHMGIAAVGFGIGAPLATFGALLHMFNHAVVKAGLFFTAGNLSLAFGTRRIEAIEGTASKLPATTAGLVLGAAAAAGAPPFAPFISEFLILSAAVQTGQVAVAAVLVVLLVVIFGGFLAHVLGMSHGPPRGDPREPSRAASALILGLVALALVLGLWVPEGFRSLVAAAAGTLGAAP